MDFNGKVVIITGASSGIGAGTAKYLAKLGASLVLTGRNEVSLAKTGQDCEAVGKVKPLLVVADVTKEEDNARVIDETVKKFGKLDVLVNNAGKGVGGSIESTSMSQFDDCMNTNLRGVFHPDPTGGSLSYQEQGKHRERIERCWNQVVPECIGLLHLQGRVGPVYEMCGVGVGAEGTVIVTEFHKRLGMDDPSYQAYLKRSEETHALGRVGTTAEVAAAIAFLAADTATFITGTNLCVDGGKNVMCPR
ncbi:hypothetical protein quinque_001404 [Culex quinquefasciatus]